MELLSNEYLYSLYKCYAPLSNLLDAKQIKQIQQCLGSDFDNINPLNLSIKYLNKSIYFDGAVHRL